MQPTLQLWPTPWDACPSREGDEPLRRFPHMRTPGCWGSDLDPRSCGPGLGELDECGEAMGVNRRILFCRRRGFGTDRGCLRSGN